MKNNIRSFIYKGLIVVIIVLFGTLITSKNEIIKASIYKNVYSSNINFSKIKKIYNTNIGSVLPFEKILNEKKVFNETLKYNNLSTYNNGIKLDLDSNYSIPIISDGIVIFIGEKENLNKTVIIEDENGVDIYYGNLSNINVKLYDYVSKNDLLGTAKEDKLYMLFEKDNKYLDYKEFLK